MIIVSLNWKVFVVLHEISTLVNLSSGLLMVTIGLFFLKKAYREYLNQLIGFSLGILGFVLILDSFSMLIWNLQLYELVEYSMIFIGSKVHLPQLLAAPALVWL